MLLYTEIISRARCRVQQKAQVAAHQSQADKRSHNFPEPPQWLKCRQKDGGKIILLSKLTCSKQDYSLHTGVFCCVHMQHFQLLHLFLKYPNIVHKCYHPVSSHGRGMKTCSSQERSNLQWHVALGGVEDEQLGPDQPQEANLISHLKFRKAGYPSGPLNAGKHDPSSHLTDGLDVAHVALHLDPKPGGVGLGSDQHGDVGGEVANWSSQRICRGCKSVSHKTLVRWYSAWLDGLFSHSHFEAFLQSTMLALVPMMLVNGAVFVSPACVGQISSNWPLEKALAPLACNLSIVFTTGLVRTNHADQILTSRSISILVDAVSIRTLGHIRAWNTGCGGWDQAWTTVS